VRRNVYVSPQSPREPAPTSGLQMARRQPWFREEHRLIYLISDRIRCLHQLAARRRRRITEESDAAWVAAEVAAALDREAECLEAQLDEALI